MCLPTVHWLFKTPGGADNWGDGDGCGWASEILGSCWSYRPLKIPAGNRPMSWSIGTASEMASGAFFFNLFNIFQKHLVSPLCLKLFPESFITDSSLWPWRASKVWWAACLHLNKLLSHMAGCSVGFINVVSGCLLTWSQVWRHVQGLLLL